MIIQFIKERMQGRPFDLLESYFFLSYAEYVLDMDTSLSEAMISRNEVATKMALCNHIMERDGDPDLCNYVWSVCWTEDDAQEPPVGGVT